MRTEVRSVEEKGEGARLPSAVRSGREYVAGGGVRTPFLARSALRHSLGRARASQSGWLSQSIEGSRAESRPGSAPFRLELGVGFQPDDRFEFYNGYTIADLASCGMTFSTEKRKGHLTAILNGFGVRLEGEELRVHATAQDFPQKKHNLVQAMLAVNDMFVMGEEHVLSLFKEDVAKYLESHSIPIFPDFKLSGRSGFDHKFDFGLPKTPRSIQALEDPTYQAHAS